MITNAARHTVRVSYLIVGALLILLALFTMTARVGLPLVASHKTSIESRVSDYLKSPVEIGKLSLRWEGFGPLLHAERVAVYETAERSVTLDELLIDINLAKSLLRGIPIINELSLVGARLAIEADAGGQIRLHGMDSISSSPAGAGAIAPEEGAAGVDIVAWLFNARKVGLLDTQLTLIDLASDNRLVIDNLNIRAENNADIHQLRVEAVLPSSLGGRLEAGIDLVGEAEALSESSGDLYLSAKSVNLDGLAALLGSSGLLTASATEALTMKADVSVEMWGRWEDGQLVSAGGPLTIGKMKNLASGSTLLDGVSAQIQLTHSGESTTALVSDIQASLGSATMQIEQILASKSPPDSTEGWHLDVKANELPADLALRLAGIVSSVHLPELALRLRGISVEGALRNLEIDAGGSMEEPRINASADIEGIAFAGDQRMPAFGPLSGELLLVESAGKLNLSAEQMQLAWPAASNESVDIDSLQATIDINVRNPARVLLNTEIELVDGGIDSTTRAQVTLLSGSSPLLDLQSRFDVADITTLKSWLPRNYLSTAAVDWIERAITGGEAVDGSLLFFGNLSEFPFKDGEGVFRASVDIRDGKLAFLPGWPIAKDINGTLELEGLALTGLAENSSLDGFNVSQTRISIADLAAPVIDLSSTASGQFQDIVDFGVNGPLKSILGPAIGDISGTGSAQMDLALTFPLYSEPAGSDDGRRARLWRPFSIDGSLFMNQNDVVFGRAGLELKNAGGAVGFNEQGIAINNLHGRVLGHDVRIIGQTQGQGTEATTAITIKGALEANDLLAHYGNTLDQFIRGASQWSATISAPHSLERVVSEGVGLSIRSDLVGAQLLLPAPFDKGSSSSADFELSTSFRDGAAEQYWNASYGEELRARVKLVDDSLHSLLIDLGPGELVDLQSQDEQEGIRLQGGVPSLAADGWVETIARYIDSLPPGEGAPLPILPVSADVKTDALVLGQRSFGEASFRSTTDDTYLNLTVSNQALQGNLRYPREHWHRETALKARVELLDWSIIDALSEDVDGEQGSRDDSDLDPRLLPPIDARISMLSRENVRIRDLELRAEPNVSGLDVTTLGFAYDTMRLAGQGYWHLQDSPNVSTGLQARHASQLDMVLQSDDFGAGFDEIGLSGIVDDAQGSIEMRLDWPGPLYKPEIARLDGNVDIDLQAGSIVPLEPGGGRVVGLFALQALPRRLNLDFKDLTGAGLAFTTIAGSAVIEDGVAEVPLLQLTGPIGVVDIVGSSDLNTRQFDQQVTVLPRISAALPIIGAISGGATGGIGALVAAGLLKAMGVDFDRIGLRTYQLTGDFAHPEFTPVSSDYSRRR